MTGRKSCELQVPLIVPYKALEKFPKDLCGATGGTCSARFFRPVVGLVQQHDKRKRLQKKRFELTQGWFGTTT